MKTRPVQMIVTLIIIGAVSAFLLAYTAQLSYPLIEEHRRVALEKAILEVLPDAKSYKVIDPVQQVYKGLSDEGIVSGYAFVGSGGGYQGTIKIMIGISSDLKKLSGIEILENIETPGLGAKITSDNFQQQFQELQVLPEIELIQNRSPQKGNQIQAITGATISSRAVVKIINQSIESAKEIIAKNENERETH